MSEQVVNEEKDAPVINVKDIKEEVVNEDEVAQVINVKYIEEEVVNEEDALTIDEKDIKEEEEEEEEEEDIFDMVPHQKSGFSNSFIRKTMHMT